MISDDSLAGKFQVQQILASALAASLLVYAVVVEVLRRQALAFWSTPLTFLDSLRFIFVFLAFAVYFVIRFGQQKILVKKPTDSREVLLAKLSRASLLSLILAELPAMLGFVLFLLSGNPRDFYLLMVISLLLFYVAFPRYRIWVLWSQPRPPGLGPEP